MNFDTAAAGSIVTLETVARLGRTIDRAAAAESTSIKSHASFPPFEATLALGSGRPAQFFVTPIERKPTDAPLGNVGVPWMKGRRVAISPDGRNLLYTAVAGVAASAP